MDEIIVPYLKQTIFILKAAWVKYRKKKKGKILHVMQMFECYYRRRRNK